MKETIGDIDILVASDRSAPFMEALTELPSTAEVIAHGEKKTSIRTVTGVQVDLRVVRPDAWGAGMQYFTGSEGAQHPHSHDRRPPGAEALQYGLFDTESGKRVASRSEDEVYARLGPPWIPPTLARGPRGDRSRPARRTARGGDRAGHPW